MGLVAGALTLALAWPPNAAAQTVSTTTLATTASTFTVAAASAAFDVAPASSTFTLPAGPSTFTLVAVGDIRLDGPVGELIASHGPAAPTERLRAELQGDIRFGNLECPVTAGGRKVSKKWNFRAAARSLKALASFDVLNLANNHVMDFGPKGLVDTLKALDAAGLPHIGAGRGLAEALAPRYVTVRGTKVGFLGFTSTFPSSAWAAKRRPGVAFSDPARAAGLIRRTKALCDVLVVSFHGGKELADAPNAVQTEFAHAAIDAGADLVLGHHPHTVQPVERYRGRFILYSLGNFLFVSPNTRWSVVARVVMDKGGAASIDLVPIDTWYGDPHPADLEGARAVCASLDGLKALRSEPRALLCRGAR